MEKKQYNNHIYSEKKASEVSWTIHIYFSTVQHEYMTCKLINEITLKYIALYSYKLRVNIYSEDIIAEKLKLMN